MNKNSKNKNCRNKKLQEDINTNCTVGCTTDSQDIIDDPIIPEHIHDENCNHDAKEDKKEQINNEEFLTQMKLFAQKYDEEIKKYEEQIINLQQENLANLSNQKKYYMQEMETHNKYLLQKFFTDILMVLDSLEIGLTAKDINYMQFLDGLKMTHGIFLNICKQYHVELINTQIGDIFDDTIHECIGTNDTYENNKIASIASTGYKLKERILRSTKVFVGTK
jgi:molecular chaperone GrpE (heat shock protein)